MRASQGMETITPERTFEPVKIKFSHRQDCGKTKDGKESFIPIGG